MKSRSSRSTDIRRARPLLGTFVEITAPAGIASAQAVERAFTVIAHVEKLMNAHDEASDLGRLCSAPAGSTVTVHPWTWRVLGKARSLSDATRGAFDPIAAASFGVATARLPKWTRGGATNATWRDVTLLRGNRVRLLRPVRFDLGGIAKGFAVDRAIATLRAARLEFALVNAGGDLRAFGTRSWPIHVRDPQSPGAMIRLGFLHEGAIATSAPYFSRTGCGWGVASALLDPISARSIAIPISASVFARTCLVADALTKALLCGAGREVFRAYRASAVLLTHREGAHLAA